MSIRLNTLDTIALVCYFILVIGFGIWSSFKNRGSIKGYFLAGRNMGFIPIAASLYSSNIGSMHFIGFAGSGCAAGIYVAGYEIYGPMVYIILGWIFLPVYISSGVFTMPEYIKKRFGGERIGVYLSLLSLLLYIFTKISADLYAGALFINLSFKFNIYVSIGILLLLAALFTIGGGLTSVMWTDFIQTIVMIVGAVYLTIISFMKVDGIEGMKVKYGYSIADSVVFSNSTCGLPPKDYYNMIKPIDSDFPWTGLLIGQLINGAWYVCNDQVIVQRVLAAKNLTHARAGCIGCGYLKLLSLFLMIMPGMVARILFRNEVACADPQACYEICGNEGGCTNIAYPKLVMELLPTGARGLMVAAMMAALMSSLTSIFNSTSTIFTMDIWKRIRKDAKDWELMIVGRLCVVVLVVISVIWIPVLQASQGSQLFDYIQSVTSFLAPPVCAIYVLAIFFKRINEKGAFWGLIVGLIVGMIRFIWQHSYSEPVCSKGFEDTRPAIISKVHYLHFSIILFIITIISSWTISILTEPIPIEYIRRYTYFTKNHPEAPVPMPVKPNVNENKCIIFQTNSKKDKEFHKSNDTLLDDFKKSKSIFKRFALWICGIESFVENTETENTDSKSVEEFTANSFLKQTTFWSHINNLNMVVQLCISGFMWVFFNKFNS